MQVPCLKPADDTVLARHTSTRSLGQLPASYCCGIPMKTLDIFLSLETASDALTKAQNWPSGTEVYEVWYKKTRYMFK